MIPAPDDHAYHLDHRIDQLANDGCRNLLTFLRGESWPETECARVLDRLASHATTLAQSIRYNAGVSDGIIG